MAKRVIIVTKTVVDDNRKWREPSLGLIPSHEPIFEPKAHSWRHANVPLGPHSHKSAPTIVKLDSSLESIVRSKKKYWGKCVARGQNHSWVDQKWKWIAKLEETRRRTYEPRTRPSKLQFKLDPACYGGSPKQCQYVVGVTWNTYRWQPNLASRFHNFAQHVTASDLVKPGFKHGCLQLALNSKLDPKSPKDVIDGQCGVKSPTTSYRDKQSANARQPVKKDE